MNRNAADFGFEVGASPDLEDPDYFSAAAINGGYERCENCTPLSAIDLEGGRSTLVLNMDEPWETVAASLEALESGHSNYTGEDWEAEAAMASAVNAIDEYASRSDALGFDIELEGCDAMNEYRPETEERFQTGALEE